MITICAEIFTPRMAGYITTQQDHDSPCIPEHWGRPHNTKVARDNVPDNPHVIPVDRPNPNVYLA